MKLVISILTILVLLLDNGRSQAQDSAFLKPADSAKNLRTVSVTAAKPYIIQRTDRITVNIAQSPIAAGGNAYEAVKRVPGIIDAQGFQFRGRNISVYLDSRPVRLSGEELAGYLSSMPATSIDRIEVLTHPSAKFEANGGIVLNIISSRSKDLGAGGTVTAGAGAGRYPRYNGGINLSYRSTRTSIYGSYDILHTELRNGSASTRSFNDAYTVFEETSSHALATSHTFKTGIDHTINKNSSLGLLIRGSLNEKSRDISTASHQQNHDQSADSFSETTTGNHTRYLTPSVNLYYKLKKLTINADYFSYAKDYSDDIITRYADADGKEYRAPFLLGFTSAARNTTRSLSVDDAFNLGKIQLQAGIKTVLTTTDNTTLTDRFIYDENIYSIYTTASRAFGAFNIQAGLRAEHTYSNGSSISMQQQNKNRYTSLFPSLSVAFSASESNQLSFSYSRNIERFGFNIVNPFIIYQNQYAYYQGNPNIKPSFNHSFEMSWAHNNEWMVAFDYSHYLQTPAEIYKKDSSGQAIISTFDNVSSADQMNLNITWTKSLLKGHLSSTNTLGVLHAGYHAPASTGLSNASYTAMISSNSKVILGKGWKTELNLQYSSPMAFGAYKFKEAFTADAGISKSILDNKGMLSLSITDIFNSYKRRYTASSFGVNAITKENPETRFVKLIFTYKFGNAKVKAAGQRRSGIEDIQNRMN